MQNAVLELGLLGLALCAFALALRFVLRLVLRPLTAHWVSLGVLMALLAGAILFVLGGQVIGHPLAEDVASGTPATGMLPDRIAAFVAKGFVLGLNLVALPCLIWIDKRRSMRGGGTMRIPENSLHLLSALGGAPGSFVAQRVCRHKTSSRQFQKWFWMSCIPAAAIIWLAFLRLA